MSAQTKTQTKTQTKKQTKKKGISLFRAKDAVDLMDTDLMSKPEMSPDTQAAFGTNLAAGLGAGAQTKVLLRQSEEEGGFSLVTLWFKAGYPLPRHTHNVDCLYYVISGSAIMGNQTLRAGDGFFVPEDAPYQYNAGPEGVEVLEIRHGVEHFDMKIPDFRPEVVSAVNQVAQERRNEWEQMHVSPTMAANGDPV
jgi:mannose-6-phosphate isomerase-like protein (cupin superfamily)